MKVQYELYLRAWASNNPNAKADLDFETVDYEPCVNYRDAVKQAKSLSAKVPFKTCHGLEIQRVEIAAYYDGDEAEDRFGTQYYLLWKESYENGKKVYRINCE